MLKMTISKIRKICSVALIPRILRDEFTLSPRKLGKRPLNGFWNMYKSSDSKDKQAECEKCKKLIEMVFGPEKPNPILKQVEANIEDIQMDKLQKAVAPSISVKEKWDESVANDVLSIKNTEKNVESTNIAGPIISKHIDQIGLHNILQSTTATDNKEELAQKLETIEEPVLVEAATPKTEGFNTPPKVLGDRETIFDSKKSLCTKIGPEGDALDEIAKKCLSSPPDKIDERIIEEMKSCGMLGRGRKKSSARRHGSCINRSNKKDTLLETKSDESTLYCEKPQKSIDPLHAYPSVRYHNIKFTHNPEKVYPAYFKNVPLNIIGDGHIELKMNIPEKTVINPGEGKTKLSTDSPKLIDSYQQIAAATHHTCDSQDVSEEVITEKIQSFQAMAHEEAKPQEFIEKELDIEEIYVTAAETGRLGIPGQNENEVIIDQKPMKPDILTCNQMLRATETQMADKSFAADKRESYIALSNHPSDWQPGMDLPERPFNSPNTAISGTYTPSSDKKPDPEPKDTAISAWQNPGEFYELSHCDMEKLDAYAINPSTIRPLESYHPYTIISGMENVKKPQNRLFSNKEPLNVATSDSNVPLNLSNSESQHPLRVEKTGSPETHKTINKEISTTMGTLPDLKDIEEELSLTEMLKKVRERNRLQLCRDCEYKAYKALEAEPAEANRCNPPVDKGPPKTLGPGPCNPKAKPACPPPPPKCPPCPPPCPPPKQKDPCAKFAKTNLIGYKIKEAFSLVLNVGLKPSCGLPILPYNYNVNAVEPLKRVIIVKEAYKVETLGSLLLSNCLKSKPKLSRNEVILAKDYEPWIPIPSWPIPEKEKKEPFVCPKEGCKLIPPPRLNPPCKQNSCINMPKRSFSVIDFDYDPLYLYDDKF